MSDTYKPGMGFEVNIRNKERKQPKTNTETNTQFCLAILSDFSGEPNQTHSTKKPLSNRKIIAIDRDNFDEVLSSFGVAINIHLANQQDNKITINIENLDDFHPDTLFEKLEIFSKLRSIRHRLKDKTKFQEAANEIIGWLVSEKQAENNTTREEGIDTTKSIPKANLLDNILDSTQQTSSDLELLTSPGSIDQYIKQIIAPYVEPSADPRQQEMIDAVDAATAEQMRQILHHPDFQSIEAAWRSLYFLISRIETNQQLKIYLLDASKQDLEEDISDNVSTSALHKLFCEPAMNDIQWSLLVGNYTFEDNINDVLLLSQFGSIAQKAEAPFIAGAKETLAGCESFGRFPDADDWQYNIRSGVMNAWNMLRQDPVADYIGLALPRFLLRAPYGKKSSPIDSFTFEEMTDNREECHERHLWGNAAFVKAEQLARAFNDKYWDMNPSDANQTNNLPMYSYKEDGETLLMPCAEIYLTEKGGRKIFEQGLIPLWSVKNMDAIRSSDFNSLSADAKPLQGRWVK